MDQNILKVNDLKKYVEKCRCELTDENCFGCPLWVRSDHGLEMKDDEILVFNPSPLVKFLDEGDVLSVKTAFNPTTELKLRVRNAPIDELSKQYTLSMIIKPIFLISMGLGLGLDVDGDIIYVKLIKDNNHKEE